ncbi:SWI/SNF-related matrix-associated actin-dependent regulator of chromatin subfamily A containing DEAD/H box 1 homolog [Ischnura elegans]|uniref:SWI/SNF-related matrix-associated actin-dependent regulator of chromatin subfamily A containing DEAD/H box 1 homolog n=1 Tax=Ischnura elegans TaxID=197161 RepID=UPI001ED8AE9F|nr:SWI/SNF-related matrix-associated actin-dependent regulator of chromatin subfamily A containing DEAD/H box 1 homolog [Ischnura elegans]
MSDNAGGTKASPSLLTSLRRFRFQKSTVVDGEVTNTSEKEPEGSSSPAEPSETEPPLKIAVRRAIGRIIDSDSDDGGAGRLKNSLLNPIIPVEKKPDITRLKNGLERKLERNNVVDSDSEDELTAKERSLQTLVKMYPDVDEMDLLDVLARHGMDLQRAVNAMEEDKKVLNTKIPKSKKKSSILNDGSGDLKAQLNGCIRQKWNSLNEGLLARITDKKMKRRKHVSDDEDDDDDDDGNPYSENKVYESDDSEEEVRQDRITMSSEKQAVLDFFSDATLLELSGVPTCSRKKAEVIIGLRPFESWADLVKKLEKNKVVGPQLLNHSHTVLRLRSVITRLMQQCKKLSDGMKDIVRSITSGEMKSIGIKTQPKLITPHLKLASYQMVGLNWLFLMRKQGLSGILADEMGLGKTIQVIAFLAHLKERAMKKSDSGGESDEEVDTILKQDDYNSEARTHLIVVPSSTLENWMNELDKWCPSLTIVAYYGSQEERQQIRYRWLQEGFDGVDVIVTTYHMVSGTAEGKIFRKLPLDYVIFDEAHMLKNMSTQRYGTLIKVKGNHRILLTGTPLQNNLVELMSLLVFVMPGIFAGKKDHLKQLFSMYPRQSTSNNPTSAPREESKFEREQVRRAKEIMRPFFLRRLKQDVLQDLPKKTEQVCYVPLAESQKQLYDNLIGKYSKEAEEIVSHLDEEQVINEDLDDEEPAPKKPRKSKTEKEAPKPQGTVTSGMSIMMQLRKLANHPLLVRNIYKDEIINEMAVKLQKDPYYDETNLNYIMEDLSILCDYELHRICLDYRSVSEHKLGKLSITTSGKFQKFDEIFPKLREEGHRVLIFSQFIMMMDLIGEYLTYNGLKYLRLDGSTPVGDRQTLIDTYNSDEDIFAFILSTRAGGMGINLTAADTVVIHDLDFNPYNDKQAEDRCHRVGQNKDVTIIRLIGKDTIEEGIYQIAQEKLNLEREVTDEGTENVSEGKKEGILRLLKQVLGHDIKGASQGT